jgi:integrase
VEVGQNRTASCGQVWWSALTAAASSRPRPSGQARANGTWLGDGLVFTTRYGSPIEPRNFSRSFDRRIAKANVPRITVHGARRTCGSLLAALDVHPRVAMQILRHSKIGLTMEIYTEVPSAATRDALKRLGQWLGN